VGFWKGVVLLSTTFLWGTEGVVWLVYQRGGHNKRTMQNPIGRGGLREKDRDGARRKEHHYNCKNKGRAKWGGTGEKAIG